MSFQNIKGTFDYLPKEQIKRNEITNKLSKIFESYGYLPIETATLCSYDLLASKYAGGAEILKEIYTLEDQGKRKLGLRYDLTVPFAKFISLNKNITFPLKRYEIGKVFRDGPVKTGRNREFYQCDVDVCGLKGQLIEAEILTMAYKCFKELGIDIYIEWNNRKLLSGLIIEANIDKSLISKVILAVDKLAKIGENGVREELKDYAIENSSLDKLFAFFKLKIDDLINIKTDNEILLEGLKEVIELQNYLDKLHLDICRFTPYLARGLEIYTGTVFEVFDKEKRITSSLAAGGRYDKIITNFIDDGCEYPAVGMSFGLAPIYEIVKLMEEDNKSLYDLMIIPLDTEIESLKLANDLRDKDIKVIVEMSNRKLKKALDYANKTKIPFVIILGEDELKNKEIEIKDMFNSKNITISLDNIDKIKEIITNRR